MTGRAGVRVHLDLRARPLFFPLATVDMDPWDLVRVEVADHPEADATSHRGSVLLAPPSDPDLPWRTEAVPEIDGQSSGGFQAWEAVDALAVEPWHEAGIHGAGVSVAVFDVQWFHTELYEDELGSFTTHDCYAHRSCEMEIDTLSPRFAFEQGAHGRACAEVIHDIAPKPSSIWSASMA